MTYYITITVHTQKALGTAQQDKLREAVLAAIDAADRAKKIPYGADCATAEIGGEEA
jgi:hypothetical protein